MKIEVFHKFVMDILNDSGMTITCSYTVKSKIHKENPQDLIGSELIFKVQKLLWKTEYHLWIFKLKISILYWDKELSRTVRVMLDFIVVVFVWV